MQLTFIGTAVIGLVVLLLGVCALIVTAYHTGSWKTLVALPLGILLMLGIGSVMLAVLAAPNHRAEIRAAHVERMAQVQLEQQRLTQDVAENAGRHAAVADARRTSLDELIQSQQASVESQQAAMQTGVQRQQAAMQADVQRQQAVMQAAVERQQAAVQRAHATAAESYQTQFASRSKLALIIGVALLIAAGVVTLLFVGRKWIARHAGVLLALAGIGGIGVVGLLAVGVPFAMQVSEDARRAELKERLREIGESFHDSSSSYPRLPDARPEPGLPPAPTEVVFAETAPAVSPADTSVGDASAAPAAETPTEAATPAVALPDWITAFAENPTDFNATGTTVLVSDQWATVQESEQQLETQAALVLAQRLRSDHPEMRGWRPTSDLIHHSHAITQRFVEPTTLRVGEFDAPMYRSYWQVEYTPGFASAAFSAWKQVTVQQRLWWLGGGSAGLTLLFALAAAALRIDSATGGRYRGRLTFAAVGVCTTLGAALLLMA